MTKTAPDQLPPDTMPPMNFISARDFDYDPPLLKPDGTEIKDKDKNPRHTTAKNCKDGTDVFDYHNEGKKEVIATLIIRKNCKCELSVLIQKIEKLTNPGKNEKPSGDTKEKKPAGAGEDKAKEKKTRIYSYFVDKTLAGSDVFSFKIAAESRVRVTIQCEGIGASCDFERYFSVTKQEEVKPRDQSKVPKLLLWGNPQPDAAKISVFKKNANECISRDTVFYFVHNLELADTMKLYYRAVSECDCYFEAYDAQEMNTSGDVNDQRPREGDVLGADDKNKNVSKKIAKPSVGENKLGYAEEDNVLTIKPGKLLPHAFIIGRCPVQQPRPGPCKGYIMLIAISYTNKAKN